MWVFPKCVQKPLEGFNKDRDMILLAFKKISLWRPRLRRIFLDGKETRGSKMEEGCQAGGYFSKPNKVRRDAMLS